MKTPEEIKNALERCKNSGECKGYTKGCTYFHGTAMCISELAEDALAYIQQLEAQQPRWISVKEREPESFTNVLGYIPNNDPSPPVRECFRVCVGDADYYYFPVLADYKDITHWMEIPEPPKEENENVT